MENLYKINPYILLVGLIFSANIFFAQSHELLPSVTYSIQDLAGTQSLPSLSWIIEEGEQGLNIDDIIVHRTKDSKLIDLKADPLFNFRPHRNYWFKIRLHSENESSSFGLVLNHDKYCWPYEYTFDNVEAYRIKGAVMTVGYSGTTRTAAERDFPTKINPSIILLETKENESQDIWVKLSRAEICMLEIGLKLSTIDELEKARPVTAFLGFHTFSFGAIAVLFCLALLLYIWFKEKVYLWFMLFQLFLLLAQIGIQYRNEVFNLFFQNHPRFFVISISIVAPIWIASLFQFGRIYIDTKSKFPNIHKLFSFAICLFLLGSAIGNIARVYDTGFRDYFFLYMTQPLLGISLLIIFSLLIALIFTKDRYARMYGLAIVAPIASILYVMITITIFEGDRADVSVIIISAMVTTMTLALAYRFRTIMTEKEVALNEKLSAEKHNFQQLQRINEASNKFVPQVFLNFLGKQNILEATLGDYVEKQVAVLFSDIRDYTSLSEGMSPEDTFRFVTGFNRRMGPIIHEHDGFINQYLGDGIMAIFPKSPTLTLKGAIAMQHELQAYNREREQKNKTPIRMGIGLHTGSLIMGIIGDDERLDAATISDTVNVAARIEGLTKYYGASILISEACYQQIENKNTIHIRFVGKVIVKGKAQAIGLYECFDGDSKIQFQFKKQTLKTFEKAISHYYSKEFQEAIIDLESVLTANKDDLVAQLFLNKAYQYNTKEIEEGWSGVEQMKYK